MKFDDEVAQNIADLGQNEVLKAQSRSWMTESARGRYSYNFSFMGRPIIQYPQDMVAMQELVWKTKPDLIIETGIAHGGSLVFYAAMLELNAICGGQANAQVLGIDIDIRADNRAAIEAHPMARRINMIQGSSIAPEIVRRVREAAEGMRRVLVVLDSNHTHDHVLAELEAYSDLVTIGSYCVVFDTVVEDLPADLFPNRPWGPGDNPKTAVHAFLARHPNFEIDRAMDAKLQISVAPEGFLMRVR